VAPGGGGKTGFESAPWIVVIVPTIIEQMPPRPSPPPTPAV
jgi:hypothetical protein